MDGRTGRSTRRRLFCGCWGFFPPEAALRLQPTEVSSPESACGSASSATMASCEVEVSRAAQWFGEQLFEPNEQRQIFIDRLTVSARPICALLAGLTLP